MLSDLSELPFGQAWRCHILVYYAVQILQFGKVKKIASLLSISKLHNIYESWGIRNLSVRMASSIVIYCYNVYKFIFALLMMKITIFAIVGSCCRDLYTPYLSYKGHEKELFCIENQFIVGEYMLVQCLSGTLLSEFLEKSI